jgi:hypothetical protein
VRDVFERAASGQPVSDELLVASYPDTEEQYDILRQAVQNGVGVTERDSLIESRIKAGSRSVLGAHLRYAAFIEGDEAMWYVEHLAGLDFEIPHETLCELKKEAVDELGEERFVHTRGYIRVCKEAGHWQ